MFSSLRLFKAIFGEGGGGVPAFTSRQVIEMWTIKIAQSGWIRGLKDVSLAMVGLKLEIVQRGS